LRTLTISPITPGLRVLATARTTDAIASLSSLGMETFALDVTSESSVAQCKSAILELTGERGLDILVNNAGRNYTMPALDIDFDEVKATFETNVYGVMRMVKEFAPLLIKAEGTIVMIGSLAGLM
jgi:1-acylglycerone phosphate reductase